MLRALRALLLIGLAMIAGPALAQTFPELTGRVVDQAELLSPEQEAELTTRLEALEQASSRQLVVATVASLEDYPIEDYGYQLGRHWQIGQSGANNGTILLVAPNERKVRIEVGYGLEGILPDALAAQIVRDRIIPRFRDNDYPGGITAGVDALIEQFQAPPEEAERRAMEARQAGSQAEEGSIWGALLFMGLFFFVIWVLSRRAGGRRYRSGGFAPPVVMWGGSDSGGSSWSSGGSFGGFSGGGGSFGGGGASGSW